MPAGGGLVAAPPGGPAQGEGEPGAGDEPAGVVGGEAGQPGGLGDREPDESDLAGAGLAAAGGNRRVAEGNHQVSVVRAGVVVCVPAGAGAGFAVIGGGGKGDLAVQGGTDGDVAELGEGGQGGVPADQQELPRVRGRYQRPVAVPGSLRPVAARAPLEHSVRYRVLRLDDGSRRGGDLVVAGDDRHVGEPGVAAGAPG